MPQFNEVIACTIKELYRCNGVDGFDDLVEEKLGHPIEDASWSLEGIEGRTLEEDRVLIRVTGSIPDYSI